VSTETTTRILAVVFLLPQLPQCFQRDSEILALGRSEISEGRVKEIFRSAAHGGMKKTLGFVLKVVSLLIWRFGDGDRRKSS